MNQSLDAVVVGSGPNGLSAAITLAQQKKSVLLLEGAETLGGGLRSSELTLPGFVHDECASVMALVSGSPFLRRLPLRDFGLELVHPELPLAHPLDDGSAVVLERALNRTATASNLGPDALAYGRLMRPIVQAWRALTEHFLGPLHLPRPDAINSLLTFGVSAILPMTVLARLRFRGERAAALMGGISAHSILPLERPASAAFGLVLAMLGHAVGWPVARGGSRNVAEALTGYLQALGGDTRVGAHVNSLADLPDARVALLDVAPRQLLDIAREQLGTAYASQLRRYRYGPGICKVDWALDAPIPWTAEGCRRAGTVHLGGTLPEVAAGEAAVWRGQHAARPFVILVQPTVADPSRAPAGKHTAWAYCHVPNGSERDMTVEIEAQIERFAPGFAKRILARATRTAEQMGAYNPNYVGGDINGGVQDLLQLWTRPAWRVNPYTTSHPRLFLCSSATPPGGGVHGMCGVFAARAALARLIR